MILFKNKMKFKFKYFKKWNDLKDKVERCSRIDKIVDTVIDIVE